MEGAGFAECSTRAIVSLPSAEARCASVSLGAGDVNEFAECGRALRGGATARGRTGPGTPCAAGDFDRGLRNARTRRASPRMGTHSERRSASRNRVDSMMHGRGVRSGLLETAPMNFGHGRRVPRDLQIGAQTAERMRHRRELCGAET